MKTDNITYRKLESSDFNDDLLDYYDRYQEITKMWWAEGDQKVVKEVRFVENWSKEKKQNEVLLELKEIARDGGYVYGAYDDTNLIGFAALGGDFLDEHQEYIQVIQMQVSFGYRGNGIGKRLFQSCIDQALLLGARKLYISGHPSIETQAFYTKLGCVDAVWVDSRLKALEPHDCHLEYVLKP